MGWKAKVSPAVKPRRTPYPAKRPWRLQEARSVVPDVRMTPAFGSWTTDTGEFQLSPIELVVSVVEFLTIQAGQTDVWNASSKSNLGKVQATPLAQEPLWLASTTQEARAHARGRDPSRLKFGEILPSGPASKTDGRPRLLQKVDSCAGPLLITFLRTRYLSSRSPSPNLTSQVTR